MMKKRNWLVVALAVLLVLPAMPSKTQAYDMGKAGYFQTVSTGGYHSMAIKTDGSLWAWGSNYYGELGDGTREDRNTSIKVMDGVTSVSAGTSHTMGIKADGSLWAWGENFYGQLGDGTEEDRSIPVKVMDGVAAVSAGGGHTMAIKTNGSLWAWGFNGYGRLGDGTQESGVTPVKVMEGVASVSAGGFHTMAIKADGSLWAWGDNSFGQLGDGTNEWRSTPVKVMDGVAAVSAGNSHTMVIKTDGSLWAWGHNMYGQLGDGTYEYRSTPVKVLDGVASVSAGSFHTMAIKTDGSLWAWGSNGLGQLGNGGEGNEKYAFANLDQTIPIKVMDGIVSVCAGGGHTMAVKTDGSLWAWGNSRSRESVKVMDGIKLTGKEKPANAPAGPAAGYIYDTTDPGASVVLPVGKLAGVSDKTTAVSAIQSAASGMTSEQKQSATGIDLITLYAEEAVAQAAGKAVDGSDIVIDQASVQDLHSAAAEAKASAEQTLTSAGITTQRKLDADVKFKTSSSRSVKITIDPSAVGASADNVRVETPDYAVSFSADSIRANTEDSPLVINITENSSDNIPAVNSSFASSTRLAFLTSNGTEGNFIMLAAANIKTYSISFNKPVKENIKVSLRPASGEPTYQAVLNTQGNAVGGKYNPVTNTLDVKLKDSGTYKVKENRKDFSDINGKSKEMQKAITILASKGIINGTSATAFSPDSTITRAEIAALITRTLSKYDANAHGGFTDVSKNDWYYGAAGSAKQHGIMSGTSATIFAPRVTIPKDQITAVAARVLRIEMKYKNPANVNSVLNTYTDSTSLADWSKNDLALATRENLVVKRSDGRFTPDTTMTRGDAAIILHRMFNKIW